MGFAGGEAKSKRDFGNSYVQVEENRECWKMMSVFLAFVIPLLQMVSAFSELEKSMERSAIVLEDHRVNLYGILEDSYLQLFAVRPTFAVLKKTASNGIVVQKEGSASNEIQEGKIAARFQKGLVQELLYFPRQDFYTFIGRIDVCDTRYVGDSLVFEMFDLDDFRRKATIKVIICIENEWDHPLIAAQHLVLEPWETERIFTLKATDPDNVFGEMSYLTDEPPDFKGELFLDNCPRTPQEAASFRMQPQTWYRSLMYGELTLCYRAPKVRMLPIQDLFSATAVQDHPTRRWMTFTNITIDVQQQYKFRNESIALVDSSRSHVQLLATDVFLASQGFLNLIGIPAHGNFINATSKQPVQVDALPLQLDVNDFWYEPVEGEFNAFPSQTGSGLVPIPGAPRSTVVVGIRDEPNSEIYVELLVPPRTNRWIPTISLQPKVTVESTGVFVPVGVLIDLPSPPFLTLFRATVSIPNATTSNLVFRLNLLQQVSLPAFYIQSEPVQNDTLVTLLNVAGQESSCYSSGCDTLIQLEGPLILLQKALATLQVASLNRDLLSSDASVQVTLSLPAESESIWRGTVSVDNCAQEPCRTDEQSFVSGDQSSSSPIPLVVIPSALVLVVLLAAVLSQFLASTRRKRAAARAQHQPKLDVENPGE